VIERLKRRIVEPRHLMNRIVKKAADAVARTPFAFASR